MNKPEKPGLKNPYRDVPGMKLHDLHIYISRDDCELIRSYYPKQGALHLIACNLISSFCDEVRKTAKGRETFLSILEKRAS